MSAAAFEKYGQHVFKGEVANRYLKKQGLNSTILDTHAWLTNGDIDKVMIFISIEIIC